MASKIEEKTGREREGTSEGGGEGITGEGRGSEAGGEGEGEGEEGGGRVRFESWRGCFLSWSCCCCWWCFAWLNCFFVIAFILRRDSFRDERKEGEGGEELGGDCAEKGEGGEREWTSLGEGGGEEEP